ncbi:hypothetical protein DENIS_3466 [Desulfonema ishimotonii]|uniref:Mu-like prophage I protein n=1 Tax=Desulfonema ishimotonii TaxID=45657 RepID=A0A401FZU5_9BACT|nr:hypothetical protein [Desulfonema ishimotonii]GBC62494.1 hypothetical protein DENIS_3466 [Desulfonema ishimotonii]
MKWIDICRTGTWKAKSGKNVTFSEADLDAIVTAYNPDEREAPLVFGHPAEDDPAYGWVTTLRRSGQVLQAAFRQVPEAVKTLVNAGHYKKISLALMPDKKTLRHVGLLGATQPAVSGLTSAKFAGGDAGEIIEFSGPDNDAGRKGKTEMDVEELKKQLKEEQAARAIAEQAAQAAKTEAEQSAAELAAVRDRQTAAEIDARLGKLVSENRILPGDKPAVRAVALALEKSGEEIELSAGAGKKTMTDHLFGFLSALPDRGMLAEFSAPETDENTIDTADINTYC